MSKIEKGVALAFVCSIAALGGLSCSSTGGAFVPHSQFVYPNSNVKVLGQAKAEISKTGVFMPPNLTIEDLRKVYQQALSQVSGANVLVNYKEDTHFSYIPLPIFPIYTIRYTIEGDAARMEAGKQELR